MLAAREIWKYHFPAYLLGHAGWVERGAEQAHPQSIIGRRDIRSDQCTYFSQISYLSNWMPGQKDYLYPGEHLTPNSKCSFSPINQDLNRE